MLFSCVSLVQFSLLENRKPVHLKVAGFFYVENSEKENTVISKTVS